MSARTDLGRTLHYRVVSRLFWWRHAYPFHWAHKPLCDRFRADVLRIGSMRLCRSCALLWAGILLAIATLLLSAPGWHGSGAIAPALALVYVDVVYLVYLVYLVYYGLLGLTLVLSRPVWYRRLPRLVRDAARFTLGLVLGGSAVVLFSPLLVHGVVGVVLLAAGARAYKRERSRLKGSACTGCPELTGAGICSGYTRQAAAVRRYEERLAAWLLASGHVPAPIARRMETQVPRSPAPTSSA